MKDRRIEVVQEARRAKLAASTTLIGLDWIDVKNVTQASATLELHFLTGGDGTALLMPIRARNVIIELENANVETSLVVEEVEFSPENARTLSIRIRLPTTSDHGERWTARIVNVSYIDPFFDRCTFRLAEGLAIHAGAGAGDPICALDESNIDYTARDFDGFRQLMLDRMAVTDPSFTEQHAADMSIAMLEVLAYVGDRMSYYQDAVATEAFLPHARKRISIRRHTRLLDYHLSEGVNGRTWVRFNVTGDTTIKKGTMVVCGFPDEGATIDKSRFGQSRFLEQAVVFETMQEALLTPDCGKGRPVYDWGSPEYRLPKRATKTWLEGRPPTGMREGSIVLLEASRELNGTDSCDAHVQCFPVRLVKDPVAQKDLLMQQDITEIEWSQSDALPTELIVSTVDANGLPTRGLTVVYGNLVLADHGRTVTNTFEVMNGATTLAHPNLTFAAPLQANDDTLASAALLAQDPWQAMPCIDVFEKSSYPCSEALAKDAVSETRQWYVQPDLLSSSPFARHFVVEMDDERRAHVRFGDGQIGRRPRNGTIMEARYRIGNGTLGNVARDSLRHVVDVEGNLQTITYVTNPLPGTSGLNYENIEKARRMGPAFMHRDERCVTPSDYVTRVCTHPEVSRAAAEICWTGSRSAMLVYVERTLGRPENDAFCRNIRRFLLAESIAGTTLAVFPAQRVPLVVAMRVIVSPDWSVPDVRQEIIAALGARLGFEPQTAQVPRLGFGESVWASDLIARAIAVSGVLSADIYRLCRASEANSVGARHIPDVVSIAPNELAEVANNPYSPSKGILELVTEANSV